MNIIQDELEEWLPIEDYLDYKVGSLGTIRSFKWSKEGKNLKPDIDKEGYYSVTLSKDTKTKSFRVHRLVAIAFIPNPDNKPEVNHKDAVKSNNKKNNLEWNTRVENIQHSIELGLQVSKKGISHPLYGRVDKRLFTNSSSLKPKKVINTETGEIFDSIRMAADSINMDRSNLSNRLNKKVKKKTKFEFYNE